MAERTHWWTKRLLWLPLSLSLSLSFFLLSFFLPSLHISPHLWIISPIMSLLVLYSFPIIFQSFTYSISLLIICLVFPYYLPVISLRVLSAQNFFPVGFVISLCFFIFSLIVSILYLYFSFVIFLNLLFPYSCPIISLLLTYYLFFTYDFPMFSPIVSSYSHILPLLFPYGVYGFDWKSCTPKSIRLPSFSHHFPNIKWLYSLSPDKPISAYFHLS